MKMRLITIAVALGCCAPFSMAGDWKFAPGIAYVSGISDLMDQYESNAEAETYGTVDVTGVPLGPGFFSHYQFDSGVRLGYGIGPLFIMSGDLSHTEMPLYGTVGYTFAPAANASPYVFGGVAMHYVDGDYVADDHWVSGAVYGAGIEFARNSRVSYAIEIAQDTTEVDIEDIQGDVFSGNTREVKAMKTYDTMVTFRVMF